MSGKSDKMLSDLTKVENNEKFLLHKNNSLVSKDISYFINNQKKERKESTTKDITVVLVRPSTPGNIGAIARSMANFGFYNLILIDPKCVIDEEARNRAKHAQKILDNIKIEKTLKKALSSFSVSIATTGIVGTDYNIPRVPMLVETVCEKIVNSKGKIALIFGPEDTGLSNEELELCNYTATIPTSKQYSVMNLSHAVTIFLYELSKKANSQFITKDYPMVTGKEKDALENAMTSVINSVTYRTPFEMRTQQLVWKRVLGKAMITRREAFAMIGLLKKLANKQENILNNKILNNKKDASKTEKKK